MASLLIAALLAAALPARAQVAYDKTALDALFDGLRQTGDVAAPPRDGRRPFASGLALDPAPPTPTAKSEARAPAADSDGDGMDDDEELRVAKAVAPTLAWAKGEGCGEHDVLFQVHPHGDGLARVTYVLLFPLDCGFRSGGIIGGHNGDVQEMMVEAARGPDGAWHIASVEVPWFPPFKPGTDAVTLYVSSGKHHIYPSKEACRRKFLSLDDCGGEVLEHLALSSDLNVGEADRPAFISLARFARGPWAEGYASETAWGPSGAGDAYFCGGDPKRGGRGSLWAKIKKLANWDVCADAVGTKWTVDPKPPTPAVPSDPFPAADPFAAPDSLP